MLGLKMHIAQHPGMKFALLLMTILYVFGLTLGYFDFQEPPLLESSPKEIYNFSMLLIVCNNLLVTLLILASGLLSCGLLPLILTFREGYNLSLTLQGLSYLKKISSFKLFCLGILPHGILEIPALLLSGALGLYLGYKFIENPTYKVKYHLRHLAFVLTFYHRHIVPLIFLAAFLEVYITPIFIINFFN